MIFLLKEPNRYCLLIAICFLFSISSDPVSAKSFKKRVSDRFKDWTEEEEYADHDYYKRKRDQEEKLKEREKLDRKKERLWEEEREFQEEKYHRDLLEALLKNNNNSNNQPVAAILAVTVPPSTSIVTTVTPIPFQIQSPPMNHQVEIASQSLQHYGTNPTDLGGIKWISNTSGVNSEILASTDLGEDFYDTNHFATSFGSSPLINGGDDWKELAHWYREQNWNLEGLNDWAPHSERSHYKQHRKPHKGHNISELKRNLLRAKITALYIKKIGFAFLVALLAPLVVITVFGPFLTALSLVPLNSQIWGQTPIVNQPHVLRPGQSQIYSKAQLFQIPDGTIQEPWMQLLRKMADENERANPP